MPDKIVVRGICFCISKFWCERLYRDYYNAFLLLDHSEYRHLTAYLAQRARAQSGGESTASKEYKQDLCIMKGNLG